MPETLWAGHIARCDCGPLAAKGLGVHPTPPRNRAQLYLATSFTSSIRYFASLGPGEERGYQPMSIEAYRRGEREGSETGIKSFPNCFIRGIRLILNLRAKSPPRRKLLFPPIRLPRDPGRVNTAKIDANLVET